MADVYGRLTGRCAVAMATLGPGATNLVTGIADAFLDRAPMVAITGQTGIDKVHKELHQYVDIPRMFEPVTKWTSRVEVRGRDPRDRRQGVPGRAAGEAGPTHIELPEDIAATEVDAALAPLVLPARRLPEPTDAAIARAADLIAGAQRPIVLAGNGVLRRHASPELREFARGLHVPVAVTFMGKGAIDDRSHLSLMAVGLQARDHVLSGFDRADLVISVGYDPVEYAPGRWNPGGGHRIVHIDTTPAEVDAAYRPEVELIGDIGGTLRRLLDALLPRGISGQDASAAPRLARGPRARRPAAGAAARAPPPTSTTTAGRSSPRRRSPTCARSSRPTTSCVSDVGAHKIWVARLYQAYEPNTVIISNGFASMGIALPGAIAAALVHPDRRIVALCGDGGLLMNVQELETAVRLGVRVTVVVWRDDGYGLIDWKQRNEFGRPFGVEFGNPDFVALARSFGMAAFRPRPPRTCADAGAGAGRATGPSLVEVPIDYRENLRLTEHLGALALD